MVLTEFPSLASLERKAYLEMNEWDLETTIEQIRQDIEWEQKQVVYTAVPVKEGASQGLHPLELGVQSN